VKQIQKSLGHAVRGLKEALLLERNFRLFLIVYVGVLLLGIVMRLLVWEWLALILAGGFFLAVELLNTVAERLADILDDQHKVLGRKSYHKQIRMCKDVAASASLLSLLTVMAVTVLVFWPYVKLYVA